jgi:hypothetical protein
VTGRVWHQTNVESSRSVINRDDASLADTGTFSHDARNDDVETTRIDISDAASASSELGPSGFKRYA